MEREPETIKQRIQRVRTEGRGFGEDDEFGDGYEEDMEEQTAEMAEEEPDRGGNPAGPS